MDILAAIAPLMIAWALDLTLGDPQRLPHMIVGMGRMISACEHRLNRGGHRLAKGAVMAVGLVSAVAAAAWGVVWLLRPWPLLSIAVQAVVIYYCLAATTLIREVRMVFEAADRGLDEGRRQVARIVGRDTQALTDREVRTAALETLAENLNDGVVAPLFWYALLGLPGIVAYKMVNTLDSMVGYRNERYMFFGRTGARLDDIAGYIPARLTALLMILVAGKPRLISFVWRYGRCHASPNSGYPEAALAGILDCRFGGTHDYFGKPVVKPYIGSTDRPLDSSDMRRAVRVNRLTEIAMVAVTAAARILV